MDKRLDFRFQLPKQTEGTLIELSSQEMEKILLKNLDEAGAGSVDALWQLAHFYKVNKQHEKALVRLRELFQRLPHPEDKAECVLAMGQAMEQVGDYGAAVRYYKEALGLEPTGTFTWYFINNNLGYSLNTLGEFAEGEVYCRRAIEIDPTRPNALKNLGIALSGQGQYRNAAGAYVLATQANAADARSFHLLETLLQEHPELDFEFGDDLSICREAVETVARKGAEIQPIIYKGWRKRWILLRLQTRSILRRLRGKH